METCFIMQPFDNDKFDSRYEDVFEPAIKDCGLKPYRVDKDPSVSIPIEEIESGIKNARLCFAEISTNNPNVWFELGYAIACQKEVVLVCSDERNEKFPFDVRHRNIIQYCTKSTRDFLKLKEDIKARMKAILDKPFKILTISQSPIQDVQGLSNYEIMILAIIMANQQSPNDTVATYMINDDMNRNGFNNLATGLGIRKLISKGMIIYSSESDFNGNEYYCYSITEMGEKWLFENEDKLVLSQKNEKNQVEIDDLPF